MNPKEVIPHHIRLMLLKCSLGWLVMNEPSCSFDSSPLVSLSHCWCCCCWLFPEVSNCNEGVFWNLKQLLRLDLSRNNIINIHSMAFQNGVPVLSQLDLANNLLGKIPFMAISSMKSLKTLDLSNNRIENIEDSFTKIKLKLDKLILNENAIKVITKNSFQNFKWINSTSLQNNPIHTVQDHGFLDTGIRELDFHNCRIGNLNPGAFRGLERSLESLDLSSNRLSFLPHNLFDDFDTIRKLSLSNNILAISPNISFSSFR